MKIAVFGSNALSHFMCQKLLGDPRVTIIYHFGANSGVQPNSIYTPLRFDNDNDALLNFVADRDIDLVIINTLTYLSWKRLRKLLDEKKVPVAAASLDHVLLEWSKMTGKNLLNKLSIPTAPHKTYRAAKLKEIFDQIPRPFVLKFERDWRAGLQTVLVTDENYLAEKEIIFTSGAKRYMKNMAGEWTDQHFIVEEVIQGIREYSYHAVGGAKNWRYIGSARDYKKFEDGDRGFNTSGMGSYSPVDINPVIHEYADRFFNHFIKAGTPYIGILYLGIMEDAAGNAYVLEINSRAGEPEFQTIWSTFDEKFNLLDILNSAATGEMIPLIPDPVASGASIRIVNKNYRKFIENPDVGVCAEVNPYFWPVWSGIDLTYGGWRDHLNSILTTSAATVEEASDRLYKFLENRTMHNFTYRKDIGKLK